MSFTVLTPRDAARELSDRLDPVMDRDGNFLQLSLSGHESRRRSPRS